MTYDATAQLLAVKVIGTVESNLNYSSVNYNDPITVGIAQWYGTRAAGILDRMRDTNTGSWYGVEPSIDSQLAAIASTDPYWNTRYLTQTEGNSLVPVMDRNHDIQNQQLIEDLDGYKTVAVNNGMDPDANTAAMIFFFTMYHQGPSYALQVLSAAGPTADLTTLFNACMNNAVLGQYGGRYRTARDLITAADLTGTTPPPPPAPVVPNGNARYIEQVGDQLAAHFTNGETVFFYRSSGTVYLPRTADATPTPVQPAPPPSNGDWTVPLSGPIEMSSGYGPRPTPAGTADINAGFHYGADFIPTDGGTPDVVAPAPMVVTIAYRIGDPNDLSYGTGGNYVKGHATDGSYSFVFYHMATGSLLVHAGDTLAVGQKIGVMGGTGNVTGPHLHFETYAGVVNDPWPPPYGSPIDPLPILRAHGVAV